jgi:ureidoglycolate hydrolase
MTGGDRPYAVGYLDLQPAPLRFNWAERHMLSDELIVPLGSKCLVYVGPSEYLDEPAHLPPLETFRVFWMQPGQAVLVKPGVWHGPPLALEQPLNVLVMLLQNTGKSDTHIVRFEDTPVEIIA